MNQYSWWRYLFIALLIVLGAIYAAPNLYGTDPAIQIQLKSGKSIPADVISTIDTHYRSNLLHINLFCNKPRRLY